MGINSLAELYSKSQTAASVMPTEPVQPHKKESTPTAQAAYVQQPADQVTISTQAAQVQALAARISSAPVASTDNTGKLASVQQQIQNNIYQIPAAKVAEKLLLGD